MIRLADDDGDGQISYEEFREMILSPEGGMRLHEPCAAIPRLIPVLRAFL